MTLIDQSKNGKDFVDSFLAHYASAYYDPVKAHQYYEDHKKLKAKRTADQKAASKIAAKSALTSSKQRSTFAVALENISKAKKVESDKLQKDAQSSIDGLSVSAQQSLSKINAALDSLFKQLNQSVNNQPLNRIPPNASSRLRAFLEQQNQEINARTYKDNVEKGNLAARQAGRDRSQIVSQLNSAVFKAKTDYQTAMTGLNTKYQKIAETEKQKIHDQVPGAPKKK